jgi:hypothetical protein
MTIPCPVCGDHYPGHSAEACLERVTRQRDNAICELERARWLLVLAERRERAWRGTAVLAMKVEKEEGR